MGSKILENSALPFLYGKPGRGLTFQNFCQPGAAAHAARSMGSSDSYGVRRI